MKLSLGRQQKRAKVKPPSKAVLKELLTGQIPNHTKSKHQKRVDTKGNHVLSLLSIVVEEELLKRISSYVFFASFLLLGGV